MLFDGRFRGKPVRGAVYSLRSPTQEHSVSIVVVETGPKRAQLLQRLLLTPLRRRRCAGSRREAVDAMNQAAAAHGGTADVNPVQDLGFMYSRSLADPDGHVWEACWMDPKAVSSH